MDRPQTPREALDRLVGRTIVAVDMRIGDDHKYAAEYLQKNWFWELTITLDDGTKIHSLGEPVGVVWPEDNAPEE